MLTRPWIRVLVIGALPLAGCGDTTEPPAPRPASVAVTPSVAEISALGQTVQLTAEVRDHDGQPIPSAVVMWTSDAPAVAMVDAGGLVTAMRGGRAKVTAVSGAALGSASVTVEQQIATVQISPNTATLHAIEATVRLAAGVLDANGHEVAGAVVTWSSNDTVVAIVEDAGVVTAVGNGTVSILADAGPATGRAVLTVAQAVASVAVTPVADTVVEADTLQLAALAVDANGHEVTGTAIQWTSTDTLVAVVDASGVVTGLAVGVVVIEASTASGVTGVVTIEVVPRVPSVLTVLPDTVVFEALGETQLLSARVFDQVGRPMEGAAVSWSSGDTAVAVVNGAGSAMAAGEGVTVVTADAGAATAAAVVTVEQVAVSVVVTPSVDTVVLGDTLRLVAEALDANGHRILRLENAFSWTSSDAAIARVERISGLVTGETEGTAWITASAGGVRASAEVAVVNPDRAVLLALYEATGGPEWVRHDNWMTDAPLGEWYGVWTNRLGRVTHLDLYKNALTGKIPAELGNLTALEDLNLRTNRLTGAIPAELGNLSALRVLRLHNNALIGPIPAELGDLAALEFLNLDANRLTGAIPAELGNLKALRVLRLYYNALTGEIPAELGNLTALILLSLSANALTGEIPAKLGDLAALEALFLHSNALTGAIPAELGNLKALVVLRLFDNALTGPIPAGLGSLTSLALLGLGGNDLTGPIPAELGDLAVLEGLSLYDNDLTGEIPAELGNLTALERLDLSGNNSLTGALPHELTRLRELQHLTADDTELCAPKYPAFESWADALRLFRVPGWCTDGAVTAYLVQSVQNVNGSVPLVAGRDAVLRVFLTAPGRWDAPVPPVRAKFYAGAAEVYSVETPGKAGPLVPDTLINEGDLSTSVNVRIPGSVLRPGLTMVVETEADPWFGIPHRWPVEGTAPLDVRAVPTMELTIVPFLWTEDPDSSAIATVHHMAADPEGHELLRLPRALLPTSDWRVTAHDPVWSDTQPVWDNGLYLLVQTRAIRLMENGRGYWMGTAGGFGGGIAGVPGWTSFSGLRDATIAHELGHNMSLSHPLCGSGLVVVGVDLSYPHPRGRVGAWGYSLESHSPFGGFAADEVVPPDTPDVMSYCHPGWISGYHFRNALAHRLRVEASGAAAFRAPARTLLLWGGQHESDGLYLEPAFVVSAMPALPDSAGGHTLTGRDAAGSELFSVSFAMPVVADADEGAGGFVYTLPVRPGWEALATVTLSAPDGRTAVLDGSTDRPMTILRDAQTGRVRAFLDGADSAANAGASGRLELAASLGAVAITSRGIPNAQAWRR